MAGHGGGSWKVAYADFVTAMMAFFLVMWIGSQDQKTKQSVANYFIDPSGASKKPVKTGAVLDSVTSGPVAQAESVSGGRGRNSNTPGKENGPATKTVNDWLHADQEAHNYWRGQAQRQRAAAGRSKDVLEKLLPADQVAIQELSKQMKQEVTRDIPTKATGVYQDLLYGSVKEVNWTELAEDLLAE